MNLSKLKTNCENGFLTVLEDDQRVGLKAAFRGGQRQRRVGQQMVLGASGTDDKQQNVEFPGSRNQASPCGKAIQYTYAGSGLDWRKASGSGVSGRGRHFLPKEFRSFFASFRGVLTGVSSSSAAAQLHSSTRSVKPGTASSLP